MPPSFLMCWKNLDQFLLRPFFVNHPTMTVKMWKVYFRSPGNITRYFEGKYDECFIFICDFKLYLNYNAKLTTERQAINHRH